MNPRRTVLSVCAVAVLSAVGWMLLSRGPEQGTAAAPIAVTWDEDAIVASEDRPLSVEIDDASKPEDAVEREEIDVDPDAVAPDPKTTPAHIVGRLVSTRGRPIAEGRVVIMLASYGANIRSRRRVRIRTVTSADGRFLIEGPAPSGAKIYFLATHEDYAPLLEASAVELAGEPGGTTDCGDLVMRQGGAVTGHVQSSAGQPIADAEMRIRLQQSGALGELGREAALPAVRTDAAGAFFAKRLLPGTYSISARASGFEVGSARNRPKIEEDATHDVGTIELRIGAILSGQVVDPRGDPIARASLTLQPRNRRGRNGGSKRERSEQDGSFGFPHARASQLYELKVKAEGFLGSKLQIDAKTQDITRLRVQLDDGLVLTGTVVDARSGAPVEHYAVRAQRLGTVPTPKPNATRSAAAQQRERDRQRRRNSRRRELKAGTAEAHKDGIYRISGLDEGRYRLIVTSPEHAPIKVEPIDLERAQPVRTETLRLQQGFAVRGTANFGGNAGPVTGMRIELRAQREDPNATPRPHSPPRGDRIARTTTQEDGSFAFEHVEAGRYYVFARLRKHTDTWSKVFQLNATRDNLRLEVFAAANISGVVKGLQRASPDDGSDSKISVIAFPYQGQGRMHTATAGADGRYEMIGVQPGRYAVTAFLGDTRAHTQRQYDRVRGNVAGGAPAFGLQAVSGGTYEVHPTLEAPEQGKVIGVVTHNGAPAARFRVTLQRQNTSGINPSFNRRSRQTNASTTADGAFEFDDVDVGRYRITVTSTRTLGREEVHSDTITVVDGGTTRCDVRCATGSAEGEVASDSGAEPSTLRGSVVLLPGAVARPASMRDYQREHKVHRARVRNGRFSVKGIEIGQALAIVRITGHGEATQQVWINQGDNRLRVRAGSSTPAQPEKR